MDTLWFSLNAVLPILLLISLGYILKRLGFLDEHFLKIGNKFVFRVALPTLLFYTIYSIERLSDINWSVIIYGVIAVTILFVTGLLLAVFLIPDKKQKGVILQSVFRANYAIIGIPLAEAIGGIEAVAVVALVAAVIVPLINILAVVALTMFIDHESDGRHPLISTLIKIIKNPLIIGILLGLLVLLVRSWIPVNPDTGIPVFTLQYNLEFLYRAIKWIGQIASPFALIVLGGTFEFLIIKNMLREISIGTLARVALAPILTIPLAVYLSNHTGFFSFSAVEYPALISLIASPTAVSSAIMAKEMQNDEKLAVQIVVWTTSLSIVSIFIIVFLMRSFSLI